MGKTPKSQMPPKFPWNGLNGNPWFKPFPGLKGAPKAFGWLELSPITKFWGIIPTKFLKFPRPETGSGTPSFPFLNGSKFPFKIPGETPIPTLVGIKGQRNNQEME